MKNFAVLGAGAWGTTLAKLLAEKGYPVKLWTYEKDLIPIIQTTRENTFYLPGIKLPPLITPTNSLKTAVTGSEWVISAIPTQFLEQIVTKVAAYLLSHAVIISVSKGIDTQTLKIPSQIWEKTKREVVALSGPSFAREVALKLPTLVTCGTRSKKLASEIQKIFTTSYFKLYYNPDTLGIELGGAYKNVIAIAVGISDGLTLGFNARAALITRGIWEMTRLGVKMGAKPQTLSGLSGLGDLILTSTSELSRNRMVGVKLGQGLLLGEILKSMRQVAEGVDTTKAIVKLAKKYKLELPIANEVYQILFKNKDPHKSVIDLLHREFKGEFEDNRIWK